MKGCTPCEDYFWFILTGFHELIAQLVQDPLYHGAKSKMNALMHGFRCFFPVGIRGDFVTVAFFCQKCRVLMEEI